MAYRTSVDRALQDGSPVQPVLEIRVLGEFDFRFAGRAVAAVAWHRSHARRLIQMLCSSQKLAEPRARIVAALWPGFDDERARNRLHHTVHCIRKALDEIPVAGRPLLVVNGERVEFVPTPGTVIDAQVFVQNVESDVSEAADRLACLTKALALYRGALAPGWDDSPEIAVRRAWLAKLRESAIREATDVAIELGLPAVAVHHAHQLALLLENDGQAHRQYALLLADDGRPDAALLHCQSVRGLVEAEDANSLPAFDQTVHVIQLRANRNQDTPCQPSEPFINTNHQAVLRQCVAAPRRRLIGYDSLVQMCLKCLEDPFGSIVSLVGPPGSGKSLLASTVAYRTQSTMRHGAVWIDCSQVVDTTSLLDALAIGLRPLCGSIVADQSALMHALQNKELLLILDDLQASVALVHLTNTLALAGRDTRWMVTAWSPLRVTGERVIHIEPSQLMHSSLDGSHSAAAEIIRSSNIPSWQLDDAGSAKLIEQIGRALDGLPQLLEIAAQCLLSMSPNELWARLQRDPYTLLRSGTEGMNSPSARLTQAVGTWLERAPPVARRMLSVLSHCRSWLTRDDIVCLVGGPDAESVDTLIEHCVQHQFLLRRARSSDLTARSEFRVPRIATASLRLRQDSAEPTWCVKQVEAWLVRGHLCAVAEPDGAAAAARWFDHHIDDLDATATGWLEAGRIADLVDLCAVHAPHWSLASHSDRVSMWLTGLGDSMEDVKPATAAPLLLARARVRIRLGQLHLACADASHALARLVCDADVDLRQQAVQLIQRYGVARSTPAHPPNPLCGRGVEAGESLLRVAQLAVRHGQLSQALSVCAQSVEVFRYFGLTHGLIKAHFYRAKIAFALGNTDMALCCLSEVERAAARTEDRREMARADLMRADVLLSKMYFSQAIDLASTLIAKPEYANDPLLVARGICTVAWAHYGQGAYPLARALCNDLREKAAQTTGTGLKVNAEFLSAIIEARSHRTSAAIRSARTALDFLAQDAPISDVQSDLVNIAELALHLERPDLAQPMVRSLQAFSEQPDHRLRDWVGDRVRSITGAARHHECQSPAPLATLSIADVLASLAHQS